MSPMTEHRDGTRRVSRQVSSLRERRLTGHFIIHSLSHTFLRAIALATTHPSFRTLSELRHLNVISSIYKFQTTMRPVCGVNYSIPFS